MGKRVQWKGWLLAALAGTAVSLAGCGGGASNATNVGSGVSNLVGRLIDAAVSGINYRCGASATTSGTTTANGSYTCPAGQSVSFYVGDIKIGTIANTQAVTTPMDLVGGTNPADPRVTNVTQFLMSISTTDPALGVITIPPAVHTAATGGAYGALDVSLAAPAALNSAISAVAPAGSIAYTPVQAQAHLTSSVNSLFAGSYSGTFGAGTVAGGNWQVTISTTGVVTGTYTDTVAGTSGIVSGSMSTTMGTGGYAFTGTGGTITWNGFLDLNRGVFSGTWTNAAAGISGTYTGKKASFTVGGSVSGLPAGASVVLQNNAGNNLTVALNGPFAFPTAAAGTPYNVTVLTQPNGASCSVTAGAGTVAAADVTNIAVSCATPAAGGTPAGAGLTATQLAKLTAGNTWAYQDVVNTSMTMTFNGAAQAPMTYVDTSTSTTVLGAAVASGVPATITTVTPATATTPATTTVSTVYEMLDAAGNLVRTNAAGDTAIAMPATVGLNTTWSKPVMYTDPTTGAKTQIGSQTYTVTGINTSRTVAGLGTFNDVVTIAVTGNSSQTLNGISTTANWSAAIYWSAAVGGEIESSSTSTATATNTVSGMVITSTTTSTMTSTLQPGYISR